MGLFSKSSGGAQTSDGAKIPNINSARKCTDVLCCLIFIVFWCGMVGIMALGAVNGNIYRLVYATDHAGALCGTSGKDANGVAYDYKDMKRIMYPRINDDIRVAIADNMGKLPELSKIKLFGVCVQKCPNEGAFVNATVAGAAKSWEVLFDHKSLFYRCFPIQAQSQTSTKVCTYPEVSNNVGETCERVKETQEIIVQRSRESNPLFDLMSTAYAKWSGYFGDLTRSWMVILVCGVIMAFVFGFVFTWTMGKCAGCIVWTIIWMFLAGSLAVTMYAYYRAGLLRTEDLNELASKFPGSTSANFNESLLPEASRFNADNKDKFKYGAYVLTGFDVVLVLFIIAMRNRIRLAVGVIKEASRAVGDIKLIVFFPFVTMLQLAGLAMYALFVGGLLASSGSITSDTFTQAAANVGAKNVTLPSKHFQNSDATNYLMLYHFFGFLWTAQFFIGMATLTMTGAIAFWYFTGSGRRDALEGGEDVPQGNGLLRRFVKLSWRYHMGTVAFGSFLVAFIQLLRAILAFIDAKTRNLQRDHKVVRILMCTVRCCLWCFERCLKFLSNSAYTITALYGIGYCAAARDAVTLILNNALRVATVNSISFVIILLGKVFVACASAFVAFLWVDRASNFRAGGEDELTSQWLPVLFTLLVSFLIAQTFFDVYDLTINTILLCFCKDEAMNTSHAGPGLSSLLRDAEMTARTENPNSSKGLSAEADKPVGAT